MPHAARGAESATGPREVPLDDLRAASRAASREKHEPRWLAELREAALEVYAGLPPPDRVSHLWRYTDPEQFVPSTGRGAPVPAAASAAGGQPGEWPAELKRSVDAGELAGAALVQGSELRQVALDPESQRAGIVIEDLHRAVARDGVRERLASLLPAGAGKFEALNAALWRGGLLVHVPRGVAVKKPIHLWRTAAAALEVHRLLLWVEEGADVTVVDELTGGPSSPVEASRCLQNGVVEVFAGPASRVRHVTVQRFTRGVSLHISQRARVERDANLLSVWASLGGAVTKADLGTRLEGQGAEVELVGFLFGEGRQHFDHHTVHDHRVGNTRSNLDFKVVLKDRARSAYTGLIRIAPDAPRSEAYQENRNLLLSEEAKVDSIPELEILTDEVVCTHGATMGSLDPEHLFYLISRGIPRSEARRMIVGGFIEPTLNRIPEDLRERLRAHVDASLGRI